MLSFQYIYIYIYTENKTNENQQLLFVCCKRTNETANFGLFSPNGKRKTEVCFPWSTNN